jgi:hypothetical protein
VAFFIQRRITSWLAQQQELRERLRVQQLQEQRQQQLVQQQELREREQLQREQQRVRVQQQELLLSYRKQPGQQQR